MCIACPCITMKSRAETAVDRGSARPLAHLIVRRSNASALAVFILCFLSQWGLGLLSVPMPQPQYSGEQWRLLVDKRGGFYTRAPCWQREYVFLHGSLDWMEEGVSVGLLYSYDASMPRWMLPYARNTQYGQQRLVQIVGWPARALYYVDKKPGARLYIPDGMLWGGVALNCAAPAAMWWAGPRIFRGWLTMSRRRRHLCSSCGYPRVAGAAVCPECGNDAST